MSPTRSRVERWQHGIEGVTDVVDVLSRLVLSCTRLTRRLAYFVLALGFLWVTISLTLH